MDGPKAVHIEIVEPPHGAEFTATGFRTRRTRSYNAVMRDIGVTRTCGALAAIGTLFIAAVSIATSWSDKIVPAFNESPADTILTGITILGLAVWQVWTVVNVLRAVPSAAKLGRRSAIANAIVGLLAVGLLGIDLSRRANSIPFSAFGSVWLGAFPGIAIVFPPLVLIQWFCLSWSENGRTDPRQPWRGVAIGCIAYSAVLGVWVFSPLYAGWAFFMNPTVTFFNIGVVVHLLAILWLARRWKGDWALAGLVGFGCLVSGLFLVNQRFESTGMGPIDSGSTVREIGSILRFGWEELTNYLAPTAHILTALASAALFALRNREATLTESTPGDSLPTAASPTPSSY